VELVLGSKGLGLHQTPILLSDFPCTAVLRDKHLGGQLIPQFVETT
jgi:hypothetical protein